MEIEGCSERQANTEMPLVVLVAEDDLDDVFLLRRAFGKAQLKADLHFVNDGQEAIDYLAGKGPFNDRVSHPWPSLVIIDLLLPRLSGFEVLAWLSKRQDLSLPVVVLSGTAAPTDFQRAYGLGADYCVSKPVEFGELVAIVRNIYIFWQHRMRSLPKAA